MNTLVKGQVIMAELNSTEANVQRGMRPVIVIQNNIGNKFSPTLIVAPLTSRIKRDMVTHAKLYPTIEIGILLPSRAFKVDEFPCASILQEPKNTAFFPV